MIQKGLLAILLITSSVAFGQITEDPEERRDQGREPLKTQTPEGQPLSFSQRLRFGGGISSFQFGNSAYGVPFIIGVSPVAAYQASERLIVGVGVNYTYYRYKYQYTNGQTDVDQFNQVGGRGFVMYEVVPSLIKNLYIHGEYEGNNIRYPDQVANEYRRRWVTAPMAGLTYSQPISRRFGVNFSVLYNFNYNSDIYSQYVYGSPWVIRLSFF